MAKASLAAILVLATLLPLARAGDTPKPAEPAGGIQWFATWTGGLAEARRTGRPILLVSAAPHCHEISGLW